MIVMIEPMNQEVEMIDLITRALHLNPTDLLRLTNTKKNPDEKLKKQGDRGNC